MYGAPHGSKCAEKKRGHAGAAQGRGRTRRRSRAHVSGLGVSRADAGLAHSAKSGLRARRAAAARPLLFLGRSVQAEKALGVPWAEGQLGHKYTRAGASRPPPPPLSRWAALSGHPASRKMCRGGAGCPCCRDRCGRWGALVHGQLPHGATAGPCEQLPGQPRPPPIQENPQMAARSSVQRPAAPHARPSQAGRRGPPPATAAMEVDVEASDTENVPPSNAPAAAAPSAATQKRTAGWVCISERGGWRAAHPTARWGRSAACHPSVGRRHRSTRDMAASEARPRCLDECVASQQRCDL